jgi:hypothetical protein
MLYHLNKNIFAQKFDEKIGAFNTKHCMFKQKIILHIIGFQVKTQCLPKNSHKNIISNKGP